MKTVICPICNQEVSKRSTLFVRSQRICRSHDEAQIFLADQNKAQEREKMERQMQESVERIARESLIRTLRNLRAVDPPRYQALLAQISYNNDWKFRKDIQDEVEKEEVAPDEAARSIVSSLRMHAELLKYRTAEAQQHNQQHNQPTPWKK